MTFFTSNLFWFAEGILFVIVILSLNKWFSEKGLKLSLVKWALLISWIVFVEFSLAFATTSLGEGEPTAAAYGGVLFGLISIISGVLLWNVIFSKSQTEGS